MAAYYQEFDGRNRAATLDALGGSPTLCPFPIGDAYEEYFSGVHAMQKWKST